MGMSLADIAKWGLVRMSTSKQKTLDSLVSGAGIANRVVLFGDSRTAQNDAVSGTTLYTNTQGMVAWANALAGQRMVVVANKGVGGNTTADLLARMNADLDGLQFGWLVLMCDLNDAAAGMSAATTCANYELIYAYARSRGAKVIHVGPYAPLATAPTNPLTAAQYQVLLQVRDYILRVPASRSDVFAVDSMGLFGDPTANPPSTTAAYLLDPTGTGFHFNGAGANRIGAEIARIWCDQVPPAPGLLSSAADNYGVDATVARVNIIDYGLMAGSGGTKGTGAQNAAAWVTTTAYAIGQVVLNGGNAYRALNAGTSGATAPTHTGAAKRDEYGNWYWDQTTASDGAVTWEFIGPSAVAGVATGWTVQRTAGAGTAHCCTVARADGMGQDQVIGVTGAGATDQYQMGMTASVASRVVAGGTYQVDSSLSVQGASGLNAPTVRLLTTVDGVSVQARDLSASSTLNDALIPDCRLRLRPPAFTVPAGAAAITVFSGQIFPAFGAASARGVIKVGRFSLRRIS